MAELGTKLRKVKRDPHTSTDGSDLPDPFELLLLPPPPQGSLDPDQAPASPVGTEEGENLHMEKGDESNRKGNRPATPTVVSSAPTNNNPPGGASASASAQNTMADVTGEVTAQEEDGSISPPPPLPPSLPQVAPPTSTNHEAGANQSPRVRPGAPVSMKDVAAELAARVSARQRRSASPPIPHPPTPPLPLDPQAGKGQEASTADKRSLGGAAAAAGKPVSMKGMMTELAEKARAREERLGATSPPSQLLPHPRTNQGALSVQVGVKDVMRELEAKAKEKKERPAKPLPPPPPPPMMTSGREEKEKEGEGSTAPRKTTPRGVSKPVTSMKNMMAELEAAAKARGARSDRP